jgi:hypothetical protein
MMELAIHEVTGDEAVMTIHPFGRKIDDNGSRRHVRDGKNHAKIAHLR